MCFSFGYAVYKWILYPCTLLALWPIPYYSSAQSLTGTSGLVTVPTAEMLGDGEVSFGATFFNKRYFAFSNNQYHGLAYYATLGYLPFLEISLRLTRCINYPEPQAIGDRMPSVRVRVYKEDEYIPSVVLGIHDFAAVFGGEEAINFNACYVVASKNIETNSGIGKIGFHLGYGTDWIAAFNHQFVGLFGGVSVSPKPFIVFMLEHDAEKFNIGSRATLFEHLNLILGLMHLDAISAGLSYNFRL
jgi:hypothetical protein